MKQGIKIASLSEVAVADVDASQRLRPFSEAGVESLLVSIAQLGVMKDPIQVRKARHRKGALVLMAGAHRLEAARRLGWEMIPATVWECNDAWADLMEVDDNLAGAELSPLDTAVFLARRKAIYEAEFPDASHGGDRGNQHTGGRQTDIVSFCQSTSEKFAMSERHVRRLVAAGEKLLGGDAHRLRTAPLQVTLKDLQEIGRIGEPVDRYDVIEALVSGTAKSAREALAAKRGKAPPKSPVEEGFQTLLKAWARAPKAAKRSFLQDHEAEIRKLLGEMGPRA